MESGSAKVSVIMPAYNAADYIKEALDSVFSQTYSIFEIIVVDDGSTDDTAEMVKKYIGKQDTRDKIQVKYIYQENKGPAAARNRGISEAQGEYAAFLDTDDLWLPEKTGKQMALFNKSNYAMAYCDMSHVVDGKAIYSSYLKEREYRFVSSGNVFHGLLRENFIFTPTVIIKRDIINKLGCFDEHYKICEDYKMWLEVAKNYKIGFADESLVIRRRHKKNITQDRFLYAKSEVDLFKELAANGISNAKTGRIVEEELGRRYFELGYYYWERCEMQDARKNFVGAIKNGNSFKSAPYILASYLPYSFIGAARRFKRCLQ